MRNEVCVIEVKNKSIHLLIGYILNDQVKVIYKTKKELTVSLNDGDILDIGSLTNDLISLAKIDDKGLNFKYLVKEAILVIPSFGLEVYNTVQRTNIISSDGTIEGIDIKNVYSLIEKESIPKENNMLVNIIPNSFQLSNSNRMYTTAPYGLKSNRIILNANIYTLPRKFVTDLYKAFKNANISIKKAYVSSLCSTAALMNTDFKYTQFVMIQIGSKNTIVTLVDDKKVTTSTYFSIGGDELNRLIQDEFKISLKDAIILKNTYGLDNSNHTYNPVLVKANEGESSLECTRTTLNSVIQKYLKEMTTNLTNAMKVLLGGHEDYVSRIPLVMFGNTLKLKGLKEALMRAFVTNTIEFPKSNVVGASYSDFINEIGAIYLDKELEKNFLEDEKTSIKNGGPLIKEGE